MLSFHAKHFLYIVNVVLGFHTRHGNHMNALIDRVVQDFDVIVGKDRQFKVLLPVKPRDIDRFVLLDFSVILNSAYYLSAFFLKQRVAYVESLSAVLVILLERGVVVKNQIGLMVLL